MAIERAAAQALAAVERVRSLFSSSAQAPPPAGPSLGAAAQAVAAAGQRASGLSNELTGQHQGLVAETTGVLTGYDHADSTLHEQLEAAAAATRRGREELDEIAARTRSLARSAVTADTPAGQRAALRALRAEVARASSVVNSTAAQASGIAAQIRALEYRSGS